MTRIFMGEPDLVAKAIVTFREEVAKIGLQLKIKAMSHKQFASAVLRFCALPRVTHLPRTIAPNVAADMAEQHDKDILDTPGTSAALGEQTLR